MYKMRSTKTARLFFSFAPFVARSATTIFLLSAMFLGENVFLAQAVYADEYPQGELQQQPTTNASPQSNQTLHVTPRRPLEGGIEQSELQGDLQNNQLNGGVGANGQMNQGQPLQGGASGAAPLTGNASLDPDADDQELAIDWNRWRNELMQAIQSGVLQKINVHNDVHFVWDPRTQMMQSRYPNGTSAWYGLQVLPNRKIVNIAITQSSRFPSYDQAVFEAINDLQGKKLLQYPRGSKRKIVTQEGNVSTSPQTSFPTYNFNDVERQRMQRP